MRQALVFVGFGALVILVGLVIVNQRFAATEHTRDGILVPMATSSLSLTSSAFKDGTSIPAHYTCDGKEASPPLTISGAPAGTKTFALIVEDPDVPKQILPAGVFLHWLVFNIPASISELLESAQVGVPGANSAGKNGYTGPCPPPQYEPSEHRYIFTLYALDAELPLKAGASKDDVVRAMQSHVLGQTQFVGRYQRK